MLPSPIPRRSVSREPVSRMQLVFDEEDDGGQEMEAAAVAADPRTSGGTEERRSGGATAAAEEEAAGPPAASWGLGELLCVSLSLWIFFQLQRTPAGKTKQGRVCGAPWGQLHTLIVHPSKQRGCFPP